MAILSISTPKYHVKKGNNEQMTILYIPHGGGPLPLFADPGHRELGVFLQQITSQLPRPDAIVVISAHWEADTVHITHAAQPELLYDYYGFPDAAYNIAYPAPGAPQLAEELVTVLQQQQIPAQLDKQRGFDHGMFVPLKLMYPEADIPCVQLSLLSSLDAGEHLAVGKALSTFNNDKLLLLGSGLSFHNLPALMRGQQPDEHNDAFQHWLQETVSAETLEENERWQRLLNWQQAPYADYCHPRSEHLLPLHVCYAAAAGATAQAFQIKLMGKQASAFLWKNTF